MSDNPLETSPEREAEIDERAKTLWEADGKPNSGPKAYRERADELVRMELAGPTGQLPIDDGSPIPGVIVEEASIQSNLGEIPGRFTDQGDEQQTPMTREQLRDRAETDT